MSSHMSPHRPPKPHRTNDENARGPALAKPVEQPPQLGTTGGQSVSSQTGSAGSDSGGAQFGTSGAGDTPPQTGAAQSSDTQLGARRKMPGPHRGPQQRSRN